MCIVCNRVASLVADEIQSTVETNVIYGSSDFLEAFSQTSMMWRHTELSEVNPQRLDNATTTAQRAITLLESARDRYRESLQLINEHGTKPEALEALRNFDYDVLAADVGFEGEQWDSLRNTAIAGNVYGLIYDFVEGVGRLIDLLRDNLTFFEQNEMPPISNFGQLTSEWQRIIQHGYQSAQLFHRLGLPIADINTN